MEIQIDAHTLQRAEERGADEKEIVDVLRTGTDIPAKHGRRGKAKIYEFNNRRHGRYYAHKRVEVFYAVDQGKAITVTVYVFYGQWGGI